MIECEASSFPFIHLGISTSHDMSRTSGWSCVVDRFHSRLSGWKAKCHSIRGCLTSLKLILRSLGSYLMSMFPISVSVLCVLQSMHAIFFWGVDLDERRIHSVRQEKFLVIREHGDLGTRSLFAFKMEMLFRWGWRLFHCHDSIQVRVIHSLQGTDGRCSSLIPRRSMLGPWNGIIRMIHQLRDRFLIFNRFVQFGLDIGDTHLFGMIWGLVTRPCGGISQDL